MMVPFFHHKTNDIILEPQDILGYPHHTLEKEQEKNKLFLKIIYTFLSLSSGKPW